MHAQTGSGEISGLVVDDTGGAIPGAEVSVVSQDSGVRFPVSTLETGRFIVPTLPVGAYDVTVRSAGFKEYVEKGVKVDAAARTSLQITLQVGSVTESIQVTASSVALQSESAQIGRTVEARQITDLALNGRNPLNLALMKAGVVGGNFNKFNPDGLHENRFSINGGSNIGNTVTIDGVNSVRTRSGTATLGVFNVDALQEVQILTTTYPAEYGRAENGQIRFVTKSGTRDFHGSVYHFFRNSELDANSWVRNRSSDPTQSSEPAPFRFNQPGYSIGGPVYIPGKVNSNRDKLFFFVSQEWIRFRREQTNTGTTPTAAMRSGDFSELLDPSNPFFGRARVVTDPNTGAAFANNVIPQSRLSSNGIALLNAFPDPTNGFQLGADNWIESLAAPRNSRKDMFRVDWYAGKHRLSFSGQNYSYLETNPFRGSFDRVGTTLDRPNKTGSLTLTSTFSPTLINEASFAAANSLVTIENLPSRPFSRSAYGIDYPYLFPGKEIEDKIPTVQITGFDTLDGGPYPAKSSGPQYTVSDSLTWIAHPKHTLKFGFTFERAEQNNFDQIVVSSTIPGGTNNQNGRFEFLPAGNPNSSGLAIANAALGHFNSYGEIGPRAYTLMRSNALEMFAQDTWRPTANLTVEYGLRYSYYQPWRAQWNDIANFDERFYDPADRAVVDPQGGFLVGGDAYNGIVLPGDGHPDSASGRIPAENVENVGPLFHGLPRGLVNDFKTNFAPRLGIAYRLGDKSTIRAGAGVFHRRTLFWSSYLFGNAPNQVAQGVTNGLVDVPGGAAEQREFPFQIRALDRDYRAPTAYSWSLSLQRELPGRFLLETAYVGKRSINLRGARNLNQLPVGERFRQPDVNPDALRPYHGLGIITLGEYNRQSEYHSLQISADRRFSSGLGFGVAYTFSKLVDNTATPYDSYNVNAIKAISGLDRPHVLNMNFIYELPLLQQRTDWLKTAFGGWQLSGVAFLRSGEPLSVTDSVDIAGVGPGSGSQTWDLVGDPIFGGDRGLDDNWFNPAAFARPADGTFGNAGLNILRGPSFQNFDLALFKNFRITERFNMQLRFEAFNFLNHPLLNNPTTSPRSGAFGRVTSKYSERNLQIGLKVLF